MNEFDLILKHLQAQRNDAYNICANLMVTQSKLEERIAELEVELQSLKTPKRKGKENGSA